MKKQIFTLMLGAAVLGTSPLFAMDAEKDAAERHIPMSSKPGIDVANLPVMDIEKSKLTLDDLYSIINGKYIQKSDNGNLYFFKTLTNKVFHADNKFLSTVTSFVKLNLQKDCDAFSMLLQNNDVQRMPDLQKTCLFFTDPNSRMRASYIMEKIIFTEVTAFEDISSQQ